MHLTKAEERTLDGEEGHIRAKAMQIVVALGEIFGADKLIPVKSAQLAGVSYKNLGEAGLEFLQDWAKEAKVKVKATLNPAGMDLENWEEYGFDRDFARGQKAIVDAYTKMGAEPTCTCTPYYIGNKPKAGEHIAWSESSAVVYANSVLQACTNREGGPSALAAAIIGKTADYGLHRGENRQPETQVTVPKLFDYSDYSAIGYWIGENVPGIPIIDFGMTPKETHLRALSAGLATSGNKAMFHLGSSKELETVEVEDDDLMEVYAKFSTDTEPDIVCLGCPHLNMDEIAKFARVCKNRKVRCETWLCCARAVAQKAYYKGYIDTLKRAGVKIMRDTCMVVAPLKGEAMLTNSAKAASYGRTMCKVDTQLAYTDECINYALGGKQ